MSDEQQTQRSEGLLETPAASMWDDLSPASEVSVEEMQHAPQREAYVDPAVAQAQAEDEWPSWLGARWRDVPEESRAEAWTWLRSWVDWLVRVHHVSQDRIPRCWYRHSDVVEELWAAANAEAQAWESTGPTMTPMTTWHFHLQMMLDRLVGRAQQCVASKHHVEAPTYVEGRAAHALEVDEADWAAHMATVVDMQPVVISAGAPSASWRMCAVDVDGQVYSSTPVTVGPSEALVVPTVRDPKLAGTDEEGNALLVSSVVAGTGRIRETWWETSGDGSEWEAVVTSRVNRQAGSDDDDDDSFQEGE
ncbi:hypothetical protein [Kocuria marina]|uniref:hypothetical protein n=1 Tax=Kocuria marina TaxID=223184 RepID=UPI0022E1FF39|nr:hypothetical protein [Kocuria marina]